MRSVDPSSGGEGAIGRRGGQCRLRGGERGGRDDLTHKRMLVGASATHYTSNSGAVHTTHNDSNDRKYFFLYHLRLRNPGTFDVRK